MTAPSVTESTPRVAHNRNKVKIDKTDQAPFISSSSRYYTICMEPAAEHSLPPDILQRASLAGNEYAWRVHDIPDVIRAARESNLISIGGQLQFRLPDATCECYWVQVDTYKSVDSALCWQERVANTAEVALADFVALQKEFDFRSEGEKFFAKWFGNLDPTEAMWFVWYVNSEACEARLRKA